MTSAFGKAYKDEDNRFYTLDIVSKYRSTERGTGRKETVHTSSEYFGQAGRKADRQKGVLVQAQRQADRSGR